MNKSGESWSTADTDLAVKLARDGRTLCQIGEAVGRTAEAVRSRLKKKLRLTDIPPLNRGATTKSQKPWSEADEQTVMRILREGGTIVTAGLVVGRSEESVRKRLKYMRSALVPSTRNRPLARDLEVPPRQLQSSEAQARNMREKAVQACVLHLVDLMRSFEARTVGEAAQQYRQRHEYAQPVSTPKYIPTPTLALSYVGSTAAMCSGD